MISNQFSIRESRRPGAWKHLVAGVAAILLLTAGTASAQPVSSAAVKALVNSIRRLIAVLKPIRYRSSETAATVRATIRACSGVGSTSRTRGSSRGSSASASAIIRQARPRKR